MKRDIQKKKKLNNKSSECNTRFEDTYILYKYNIVIDYHHNRHRNEETCEKKEKGKTRIIKVVIVILDWMTLTSYTSTI